jgi:hypothetical protein
VPGYTPVHSPWVDSPGTSTPIIATKLGLIEAGVRSAWRAAGDAIPVRDYVTGSGDETTALQAAVTAALAADVPLIGAQGLTVSISSPIDMRGDDLIYIGNRMQIRQTGTNIPGVRVGGTNQEIVGLSVDYATQPTSGHTNANAIELYAGFQSYYRDFRAERCGRGMFLGQSSWDGSGTNTLFSCILDNWFVSGWAISAVDLKTYPGGAASTGNVMRNWYLHNNYSGSPVATSQPPVVLQDHDESHMSQINLEWCDLNGNDSWFLQRCRNIVLDSLHFEGLTLSGTAALMRAYENCRLSIRGISFTNSTIANNAGQKSMIRCQHITGSPMSINVVGMRDRDTTNTGAQPFALIEVESAGAGGARVEIVDADLDLVVGGAIVGDGAATQVRRLNEDFRGGLKGTRPAITGSRASNAALASLLTQLAAMGLVTDSTT